MKICRILIFCSISIGFATHRHNNFEITQSDTDKSVILGEIITHYLINYFSEEQIFIFIVLVASKIDQRNFFEDLFVNLFDDLEFTGFASSTFDRLDNAIHDHRNAFNLILADNSQSLS